jgi:hypothetical protein
MRLRKVERQVARLRDAANLLRFAAIPKKFKNVIISPCHADIKYAYSG